MNTICNINTALRLLFCVPTVVYLYDLQMSIVKHFSVDSNKFEFEKSRLNFYNFLWQAIFQIFQIWMLLYGADCSITKYFPSFSFLQFTIWASRQVKSEQNIRNEGNICHIFFYDNNIQSQWLKTTTTITTKKTTKKNRIQRSLLTFSS